MRDGTLKRSEYERIQGLALAIASMCKHGVAQFDDLPVNDHIDFIHEIETMSRNINQTSRSVELS